MSGLRVGYVLKRFPRASETFIAQEILELERQGVEVVVFSLRTDENQPRHRWLSEIRAPVLRFEPTSFSRAWKRLQQRAARRPDGRPGVHRALLEAFDHPQRSGRRYLNEALWVTEQVEVLELDHLHAHFANHPAFVAMLSHFLGGVSYSFTAHAKDIFSAGPPAPLWRRQVRPASFVVTVTDANRNYLQGILGRQLSRKVRRLYNGVDVDRIRMRPRPLADSRLQLLFVGRLIEKKGADVLIDALELLRRQRLPITAVLVGDGDRAPALRQRVADCRLDGMVRFTGAAPHETVLDWMRDSDLMVLPCRVAADGDRDALPTVLLEAMAAGLACISTPVNGVPEIVEHGKTGLLVPENDPRALAEAIAELWSDPHRRLTLGIAGRARVEQRFALAKNVSVLRVWLSEVAGRRPGRERALATVAGPRGGAR